MSVLPNLICRFNLIPIKIPASYFVVMDKLFPKCMRRGRRPREANTILKKENTVTPLTLPDFKTYYKSPGIGERIDKSLSGADARTQKWTPINTVNWSLTKEQRKRNGTKTVSLSHDGGMT